MKLNILISTNSNYFMATIVMLESLFENNEDDINVYLLHSNLKLKEISVLNYFFQSKTNGKLIVLEVDETLFENAPIFFHFTKEIYYRLLAQDILPKDLDRILYLDVDIIVNKSLKELYSLDFAGNFFIVAEGIGMSKKDWQTYENLGIPFDRKYFNSGVMLYNLKLLREQFDTKHFFDFIAKNSDKLKMPDQDVLNATFYDTVKYVDYKIYNYGVIHIKSKEEEFFARNSSAIIHFVGNQKPWNYRNLINIDDIFWRYAKKTIYKKQYFFYKLKNSFYKKIKSHYS